MKENFKYSKKVLLSKEKFKLIEPKPGDDAMSCCMNLGSVNKKLLSCLANFVKGARGLSESIFQIMSS